jgi:serine/threonine-protein kinase
VHVYDFVETDDQLALVMELVDGQNLQAHLREHIVPMTQRLQWLIDIAQGLAVAHDAGIIHRDLKAENILINSRNEAKISDLGIAKSQDFSATLTDHITGSYASMSPEQAMGEPLDFKSDLFSFGILAYQLLCGAHPFGETDNKLQLMQRIISHPPISPTKRNPDLPPEICDLLGQLLSKNTERRPATAHVVAAHLAQFSELIVDAPITSDETQILPGTNPTNPTGSSRTQKPKASLKAARIKNMGEHPTFDARLAPGAKQNTLGQLLARHAIALWLGFLFLVCVAAVGVWQAQPKQPRYIAVLPPNLSVSEMQESQQELIKSAVYDAIQQSVIQLDGYYLIPASEVAETQGDWEAVRRATAADELVAADLRCKVGSCTITLSRLTTEANQPEGRLRVQDARTVDVLTDNYVSAVEIVQSNIGSLYAKNLSPTLQKVSDADYEKFLTVDADYRKNGATDELLTTLSGLQKNVLALSASQTLYTEIALDLFYGTGEERYLENIAAFIRPGISKASNIAYQYNLFYLEIAQEKFEYAAVTINNIKQLNASSSSINELLAYKFLAQQDYQSAIVHYEKSITVKSTATKLHYLALAYWYSGNTLAAKKYLDLSLELSPNLYRSHELYGAIALVEGNVPLAITSFEFSLKLKPRDPSTMSNLGVSYLLSQNYAKAREVLEQARALVKDVAFEKTTLTINLADAENLLGNRDSASALYQEVVDLNRDTRSIEGFMDLTQAYAHLGEFAGALTALQQLERLDAQNINTTYTASLVHVLAGNRASAILNVENSLKNGMSKVWFSFPWFDSLCQAPEFVKLMVSHGELHRCGSPEHH